MSSCSECRFRRQQRYYSFQNNKTSFDSAESHCDELGGTLAFNISRKIYNRLRQCCPEPMDYWVGLIDDGTCRNRKKPYQKPGSTSCFNARPLKIPRPKKNRSGCYAVTVSLNTSSRKIPNATRRECDSRHSFICQLPWSSRTTSTINPPLTTNVESSTNHLTTSGSTTSSLGISTTKPTFTVSTSTSSTAPATDSIVSTATVSTKTTTEARTKLSVTTSSSDNVINNSTSISSFTNSSERTFAETTKQASTTKANLQSYSMTKSYFNGKVTEAFTTESTSSLPANAFQSNMDSAIIGGVLGSVVFLLLGILLLLYCCRSKKNKFTKSGFKPFFAKSEATSGNSNTRERVVSSLENEHVYCTIPAYRNEAASSSNAPTERVEEPDQDPYLIPMSDVSDQKQENQTENLNLSSLSKSNDETLISKADNDPEVTGRNVENESAYVPMNGTL